MLPLVLDPVNEHDYVWAGSAYSGECFNALLSLGGFEGLIYEKGGRNHRLSDAAKELNRLKSQIRAYVEHVFGCMTITMGGKLKRKVGLERSEAWWSLNYLTFHILRFLQRSSHVAVVAWVSHRSATVQGNSLIVDIKFSCAAASMAENLCPSKSCKVTIIRGAHD